MATTAEPWVPETAEEKARYAYAFQRGRETEARVLIAALLELSTPAATMEALLRAAKASDPPLKPAPPVEDE